MLSEKNNIYLRPFISSLLLLTGFIFHFFHFAFYQHDISPLLWNILAYLPVGIPVLIEAYKCIKTKEIFSEYTLMSIATIGAFCIGEYPEAVSVMLFYTIGEIFQDRAVNRAKQNITSLLNIKSNITFVIRNGQAIATDPKLVQIGDIIEVKVGERVSLDGSLLSPSSACFDTAALTGESTPKTIGEKGSILSGMLSLNKVVHIKVTKPYGESTLSRLLAMVKDAAQKKAPAERFIRKFARVYTPVVVGLAILIVLMPLLYASIHPTFHYFFHTWFSKALVFLVISCPCALVISIPLGYFGGIGAASKQGILFKGGNYLNAITKIDTLLFDKTGTLTNGIFEVQEVQEIQGTEDPKEIQYIQTIPQNPLDIPYFVKAIAEVEAKSNHPIAKAILAYAKKINLPIRPIDEVEELAGLGLKANLDHHEILVGNLPLMDNYQINYPKALCNTVSTIVCCAQDRILLGYFILSDTPKKNLVQTIKKLRTLGIKKMQILSGDKQSIVSNLGEKIGIKSAYGDLLPEGKVKHLQELLSQRSHNVAFVGDGINDAPVLAMSDIGIAMGGLGSDIAIETADVIIQTDHIEKIADAIHIGRLTTKIVYQNIALALGVKLLVLTLAALGIANLWEAVFADVGVALLAILNAARIPYSYKSYSK